MRTACDRAGVAVNFRMNRPRSRLFTTRSIRFLIGSIQSVTRSEPKSCEFPSSPPCWLRYQCQPVANAFQALKLCGPHITDHTQHGGFGCRDTEGRNVGLREVQRALRRRPSGRL
jgi:hypothetical protein